MHWHQGKQWGDERRQTLSDLMVRLRMALSEPHSGSWGTVIYDVDKDFNADVTDFDLNETPDPDKYSVNELALMLNDAQVYTVMYLYDRGYAFPEVTHRVPVYQGMRTVVLPGDFMAMESVFHHCGKDRHQVDETSIKELEETYTFQGSYYSSGKFFDYYEVRGNAGYAITSGQLHPDDVLDIDDALQLPTEDDARKVNIGDFVSNATDGSAARVTSISGRTLRLSELIGGRTDTFEALDFYEVQSAAQPFEVLRLWPEAKNVNEKQIYGGVPHGWTVAEWTDPTRMRFRLDQLPEGIHPRKARIYIAIQYDATPDADTPTFVRIAGGGLRTELEEGWNEVEVLAEQDFEPGKQYYVSVMTNDYSAERERGYTFDPGRVEIFEADKENYLKMEYTRLPIPMLRPDSLFELPPFLTPAVLEYAKMMAYQKKSMRTDIDPAMMAGFKMYIEDAKGFLRTRGPSGPGNVFMNPVGRNRWYRYYGFTIPRGYTNRVLF